jgi:hypothetical protein
LWYSQIPADKVPKQLAAWLQLYLEEQSLDEGTLLGCESGLDGWPIIIKILKYPLRVLMGFLKLFLFNFSPVVVQDVVSQNPNVFMRTLLPRFSDNFVPSCCVYAINQSVRFFRILLLI